MSMISFRARFVLFSLIFQCCGSSCGDRNYPPEPPPPTGVPVPHLAATSPLTVRVRVSKPELTVDCGGTAFSLPIDDHVFGPEREMSLATKPLAVYRPEDRPPGSDQHCALLALQLPDGPVVVRTNPGYQSYTIERDGSGKFNILGATTLAVPKSSSPTCAKHTLLSSSDSALTGNAVAQLVAPPDAQGCQMLRLRTPANDGPTLGWSACMGDAKLPFAMGDTLRVTQNENQSAHTRVVRIEKSDGERTVLWLLRGPPGSFPTSGWETTLANFSSTQRSEECRPAFDSNCGSVELSDEVSVTVGQRAMVLKPGEAATLSTQDGRKLEIHVVHSLFRPVVDPACSKDISAASTDVGLVVIERGRGPQSTPQIAAPP